MTPPIRSTATQIPTTNLEKSKLAEGTTLVDMMITTGIAQSKSAARRLIDQGAVKINDVKVTDKGYALSVENFPEGAMTLRSGKKKVHRIVLEGA